MNNIIPPPPLHTKQIPIQTRIYLNQSQFNHKYPATKARKYPATQELKTPIKPGKIKL